MKDKIKLSKKDLAFILVFELILIAALTSIILLSIYSDNFGIHIIIATLFALFFIGFIVPNLLISRLREYNILLENKKFVLQKLSKTDFTEVIPIKDEPMHENFLTKELTKRAKFYAIIMSDNTIMITLQFNHENDKIYYGGLYAENFMEHFKIID
ncbi:unknown [Clostridium sp. CAG:575]|nr:unknown [Clostridium sp. CAG:575]